MSLPILRRVLILLAILAAMVAAPAALASGQQVIEDYRDNGQIDRCYSSEDFEAAIRELDPQEGLYEVALDILREAQLRCADGDAGGAGGGVGAGVWIGVGAAVGLVALGAGAAARRQRRGSPAPPPGGPEE